MNLYTEMNRLEARARELVQQGGSGDIHCQVCTDLANEFNLWHRDMFPTWLCRVVAGIMADGPSPGDPNPTPAEDKDKQVTVFLRDVTTHEHAIKTTIEYSPEGISLKFEGYGDFGSADGHGAPVFIEVSYGHPRVLVWTDINMEDSQEEITLEGAQESLREEH